LHTFQAGGSHLQLYEVIESIPALSLLSTAVTKQDNKAAMWLHTSPNLKNIQLTKDNALQLEIK